MEGACRSMEIDQLQGFVIHEYIILVLFVSIIFCLQKLANSQAKIELTWRWHGFVAFSLLREHGESCPLFNSSTTLHISSPPVPTQQVKVAKTRLPSPVMSFEIFFHPPFSAIFAPIFNTSKSCLKQHFSLDILPSKPPLWIEEKTQHTLWVRWSWWSWSGYRPHVSRNIENLSSNYPIQAWGLNSNWTVLFLCHA